MADPVTRIRQVFIVADAIADFLAAQGEGLAAVSKVSKAAIVRLAGTENCMLRFLVLEYAFYRDRKTWFCSA